MTVFYKYLAITLLSVVVSTGFKSALAASNTGDGLLYVLGVSQDVTLEVGSRNFNSLKYLLVASHPQFPLKRSLVQFDDLPDDCNVKNIRYAKMYLYFDYAHKASFQSAQMAPNISRPLVVHRVLKPWAEAQATSSRRQYEQFWSVPYLGLDGGDAEEDPQAGPTYIHPSRPSGYMEFDVTKAVQAWANGEANYGLLIWALNENEVGRDIRFFSKQHVDKKKHPVLKVLCEATP